LKRAIMTDFFVWPAVFAMILDVSNGKLQNGATHQETISGLPPKRNASR